MRARRLQLLLALAIVGLGIASYLTFVALDREAEPFCTGIGDCQRVQESDYATVGAVPVAALGLGLYGGLIALLGLRIMWRRVWGRRAPRALAVWTFALALSGALYSAYLTYLELFVIDAVCAWCVASAVVVALICVLAAPDVRAPEGAAEG